MYTDETSVAVEMAVALQDSVIMSIVHYSVSIRKGATIICCLHPIYLSKVYKISYTLNRRYK